MSAQQSPLPANEAEDEDDSVLARPLCWVIWPIPTIPPVPGAAIESLQRSSSPLQPFKKPALSYVALIYLAIANTPDQKARVGDIESEEDEHEIKRDQDAAAPPPPPLLLLPLLHRCQQVRAAPSQRVPIPLAFRRLLTC